jgi:hypothetical protein
VMLTATAQRLDRACRLNTRIIPSIAVRVPLGGDRTINATIMEAAAVKAVLGSLRADSLPVAAVAGSAIAQVVGARAGDANRSRGYAAQVAPCHPLAFSSKLRHVRSHFAKTLSAKAALFVLLAFQLIVGLPLQTAQAAIDGRGAPMPMPTTHSSTAVATTTAHADCPMHDSANGTTPASGSNKHAPTGNHDCCHVNACQCQCLYTPAAFDLSPLADGATSVVLPSLSSAQFVAPRIDEFLRPPIA